MTEEVVPPKTQPLSQAARRELREGVDRTFIVWFVLIAMAAECLAGIAALMVLGTAKHSQIIDLVSYGVAPFAGVGGGIASYYFTVVRDPLGRSWITRFVLIAIVAEFALAVVALIVQGANSYGDIKDVLSYGLAPLAAIAGAIATYYFAK
jgi:hypothetical protein